MGAQPAALVCVAAFKPKGVCVIWRCPYPRPPQPRPLHSPSSLVRPGQILLGTTRPQILAGFERRRRTPGRGDQSSPGNEVAAVRGRCGPDLGLIKP